MLVVHWALFKGFLEVTYRMQMLTCYLYQDRLNYAVVTNDPQMSVVSMPSVADWLGGGEEALFYFVLTQGPGLRGSISVLL